MTIAVEAETMTSASQLSLVPGQDDERIGRILDAALAVFSQFSFQHATTGEIANQARMSKRDIYAFFADKHEILIGIVIREMQSRDQGFRDTMLRAEKQRTLRGKLHTIGNALVAEVLSPTMAVVRRLVVTESIDQPFLGDIFFEGGTEDRARLIAEVLTAHLRPRCNSPRMTPVRSARRFLSMLAYFPSTMNEVGLRKEWSEQAVKTHVMIETEVFLKAHPSFL